MPEAFSRFIQEQTSLGVILISQELSYREAIEGLWRVWSNTEIGRMYCHSCLGEAWALATTVE